MHGEVLYEGRKQPGEFEELSKILADDWFILRMALLAVDNHEV